jgi:hypothetical protein
MSKKQRVEERVLNTRLVAQLVTIYGFSCVEDIQKFFALFRQVFF